MSMRFTPLPQMPDIVVIEPDVHPDERGFFFESFKESEFRAAGLETTYRQDGHSRNVGKGIVRGMHYQEPPAAQAKIVRCTVGACFDVVLDLRAKSPTYGKWAALELDAGSKRMLYVPEGFAHGYQTLTEVCEIQYRLGREFSAPHYKSVRWNDPAIGIRWPLPPPILSERDARAPLLSEVRRVF
jgi:dTDP-4-dehydrorhamnose 3,5-epimerase